MGQARGPGGPRGQGPGGGQQQGGQGQQGLSQTDMENMIGFVEQQLTVTPPANAPLIWRVATLETQLGIQSSGSLEQRVNRVAEEAAKKLAQPQQPTTPAPAPAQQPVPQPTAPPRTQAPPAAPPAPRGGGGQQQSGGFWESFKSAFRRTGGH